MSASVLRSTPQSRNLTFQICGLAFAVATVLGGDTVLLSYEQFNFLVPVRPWYNFPKSSLFHNPRKGLDNWVLLANQRDCRKSRILG